MSLIKKYLLLVAGTGVSALVGFIAGLVVTVGLGVVVALGIVLGLIDWPLERLINFEPWALLLLGLGFGLLTWVLTWGCVSHKPYEDGVFLRVVEGKVVDSGNPMWWGGSNVFWCPLPGIYGGREKEFDIDISLSRMVEGVKVVVEATLRVVLSSVKFDPQVLYEYALAAGGLEPWISQRFQRLVDESVLVRQAFSQAFEGLTNSPEPVTFMVALAKALRVLPQPVPELRNISRVSVTLRLDAPSFAIEIAYK